MSFDHFETPIDFFLPIFQLKNGKIRSVFPIFPFSYFTWNNEKMGKWKNNVIGTYTTFDSLRDHTGPPWTKLTLHNDPILDLFSRLITFLRITTIFYQKRTRFTTFFTTSTNFCQFLHNLKPEKGFAHTMETYPTLGTVLVFLNTWPKLTLHYDPILDII